MTDRPATSGAPTEFASPTLAADRRSSPRIDCHTVVTALVPQAEGQAAPQSMQVFKAYSEDVSVGGARLISDQPIPGTRLFLRFLLPTFGDRYIEAEIVSQSERRRGWVTGKTTMVHVYGVRFTGAMMDDETLRRAMPAPSTADH